MSTGALAIELPFQLLAPSRAPQPVLNQCQVFAAAGRAYVLIMRSVVHLASNVQGRFHPLQITNVQRRGDGWAAAQAGSWLALSPGLLVEACAHLRWPLEDVEELAER